MQAGSPLAHNPSEFGALSFQLDIVFNLVSLLHRLSRYADLTKGREQYPYLAYCSLESIALANPPSCTCCWHAGVFDLLEFVGIAIDWLPPFRYSLDVPGHLLPLRQELIRIIRDDIYR